MWERQEGKVAKSEKEGPNLERPSLKNEIKKRTTRCFRTKRSLCADREKSKGERGEKKERKSAGAPAKGGKKILWDV